MTDRRPHRRRQRQVGNLLALDAAVPIETRRVLAAVVRLHRELHVLANADKRGRVPACGGRLPSHRLDDRVQSLVPIRLNAVDREDASVLQLHGRGPSARRSPCAREEHRMFLVPGFAVVARQDRQDSERNVQVVIGAQEPSVLESRQLRIRLAVSQERVRRAPRGSGIRGLQENRMFSRVVPLGGGNAAGRRKTLNRRVPVGRHRG